MLKMAAYVSAVLIGLVVYAIGIVVFHIGMEVVRAILNRRGG
jgi:hypothetical protein